MLATGTVLQDRYVIQERVGEGGFGVVYRASDNRLDQDVAIKELSLSAVADTGRTQALDFFEREAKLLARLSHASLPRVIDYFPLGQTYYLVMDFIEGTDLGTYADQRLDGRLGEQETIGLILPVLDALDYLHSQQPPIVHRDIKPGNIVRTTDGRIFLVDFGLAKRDLGQCRNVPTAGFVSEGYTAPEQYRQQVDTRADLYGIGATLYALLTGEVPAAATDRAVSIAAKQPDMLTPLEPEKLGISQHTADVIMRLLDINPASRYQSAAEVRTALSSPTSGRATTGRIAIATAPAGTPVGSGVAAGAADHGVPNANAPVSPVPEVTGATIDLNNPPMPYVVPPLQSAPVVPSPVISQPPAAQSAPVELSPLPAQGAASNPVFVVPQPVIVNVNQPAHPIELTPSQIDQLRRIAGYSSLSGWLWIILGIMQILSICAFWIPGPFIGIYNIVIGAQSLKHAPRIRGGDKYIPPLYDGIAGLVVTAILNFLLGGFIGVALVILDSVIRDKILSNRELFKN